MLPTEAATIDEFPRLVSVVACQRGEGLHQAVTLGKGRPVRGAGLRQDVSEVVAHGGDAEEEGTDHAEREQQRAPCGTAVTALASSPESAAYLCGRHARPFPYAA